tara:strand:+ start:27 stop:368 length:342 start_codon:yes stop_codon:yes gene_type:complete
MQETSDDSIFERAEKLALLAVKEKKYIYEFEETMKAVKQIEGGFKVKNKTSQNDRILKHLKLGKTISPLEAMGVFGVYRLAARIFELRQDGHEIVKTIKDDGQGRTYAEYSLA